MFRKTTLLVLILVGLLTSCEKEEVNMGPTPIKEVGEIPHKTENLVIVTLDGFRWQEVFKGIDPYLLENNAEAQKYEGELKEMFWAETEQERREKLMPFLWSTIGKEGQIYGNRDLGNNVNVANPYWTSYAGYHEMFMGYVNLNVKNNDYGPSSDYSIMEFFKERGKGDAKQAQIYRYSLWFADVFDPERTGLFVFGATDMTPSINQYINDTIDTSFKEKIDNLPYVGRGDRFRKYDQKAYTAGKYNLIKYKPKVTYISLAQTDYYGHTDRYDAYLSTAYNSDVVIKDLWDYLQTDPQYRNKTTLFITTDHGRGVKKDWQDHGASHPHSDETWFAVIGPDTSPRGEMQTDVQLYNKQFAATFASFLGYKVKGAFGMGERIESVMK